MTTGILIIIISFLFIVLYLTVHFLKRHYKQEIKELKEKHAKGLESQSKEVAGMILEKFLPFCEEYPYDPRDFIPIYNTFDYIVLNGRGNSNITEIIFQELKTGKSPSLDPLQQQVRNCIENGNVRYEHWKRDSKAERFCLVKRRWQK